MHTFSLLTLNCFGAPGIRAASRLRRLAEELNRADYAAVCLQEVQSHHFRKLLTHACHPSYPAHAYQQFIHAPKGGLLTLSRLPLEADEFVLFQNRGLWYTPAVTDWILHKGVLITRFTVNKRPVVVLNTHLTANYMGDWSRSNPFAKQEHNELMQVAELVNAQPSDSIVIVCGDFNIPRGSWLYESFLAAASLTDPMAGDQRPTFRPHRGMGRHYAVPIDFTLYRAPASLRIETKSDLRFHHKLKIHDREMHLSDHLAVETRLSWHERSA
jgi:endonuclease/exonuclease/phosphatase family metal-dependent hydrolase